MQSVKMSAAKIIRKFEFASLTGCENILVIKSQFCFSRKTSVYLK